MNKKAYLREQRKLLARDAKVLLSEKGSRLALIASFIFIAATAGAGIIASYLILNILEYIGIPLTDPVAFAVMAGCVFILTPPAVGGMRCIACAVCDGREVSLSEIFIVFSSFGRLMTSYIGAFFTCLRYGVAVAIFMIPEIAESVFKLGGEDGGIAPILYPIAAASAVLALLWLILTNRLSRLPHYIWSRKYNAFRALGASIGKKRVRRLLSGGDILNLLISFVTCFTYFIFHAGPLMAVETELHSRREKTYIKEIKLVKTRKDGRKK